MINKQQKQKGSVFIISFLAMGIFLILGTYLLIFSLTDLRISKSQEAGIKTYYLAEAGINEAIWKLKNDATTEDGDDAWQIDFIDVNKNPYPDGSYWQASFSRNFGDGSYTITIKNSSRGRGEIISTAVLPISGNRVSQRVVKTTVFKAVASPTKNSAIFSGGPSENIDINFSNLKVEKGNIFSNNNLNISWGEVNVYDNPETEDILEGQIWAVNNYKNNYAEVSAEAICAKNYCTPGCPDYEPKQTKCPPSSVSVPIVDFDSSSPYSFKNRAIVAEKTHQCRVFCNGELCSDKCIFSSGEFEDLLWQVGQGGTLTLNSDITYVTGSIEIKGGRHLVVNGSLVSDDNIYIGEKYSWNRGGQKHNGFSQITVTRPRKKQPSGLLAKRKISFGLYCAFQNINITGIVYANDELSIISVPQTFNITGGAIARKISLMSIWQWLNISFDNDIIIYSLGYKLEGEIITPPAIFSPVITVEHWEESY